MPDYKFTYTKVVDMVFEAGTEHEAWVQAMTFNPDLLPEDWAIKLNESVAKEPQNLALDQGPVEVDDWDFDPKDIPG
jgi:hypothetical protein